MLSEHKFNALCAQGYNRIPLVLQCPADLDTPLSVYLKLAGNLPNTFLLESVVGGERSGRYSFIGLPAKLRIEVRGQCTQLKTLQDNGQYTVLTEHHGDPLAWIEAYHQGFKVPHSADSPRFFGGLVGYFGYDTVRYIEPRLAQNTKADDVDMPDILLMLTDRMAVVDNVLGTLQLVVFVDPTVDPTASGSSACTSSQAYAQGVATLQGLQGQLLQALESQHLGQSPQAVMNSAAQNTVQHSVSQAEFMAMVAKAKAYIAAGDAMQVVLGQRLCRPYAHNALSLYRALRSINPSPYLFYYNFGDAQVVGSSPEILVRQHAQEAAAGQAPRQAVTLRPIAGTRPRGKTAQEDAELAQALLADPKEIAEHVMLIDLARNDVGRIANTGTVHVTERMVIERYSHVMHMVSNVEGRLKPGLGPMDVLRATFPAGTLSGAPKVRAMEIIDELEPTKRGVYGGACGYLSFTGTMDLAIAIRTGVVKDGMLYVQAGAGIVADSVPESEWQETENKARAVLHAAELVEVGELGGCKT